LGRLLYEAYSRGIAEEYVRRLLAELQGEEYGQTEPLKSQDPQSALIEPLSEQEREVLQLMAKGLSNPVIASRLYLSLNTVKVHTRNIYGKLGVHSRTQAIAKARALAILPTI
jgi:LuxR family maltose regulon positive regulatory protein